MAKESNKGFYFIVIQIKKERNSSYLKWKQSFKRNFYLTIFLRTNTVHTL